MTAKSSNSDAAAKRRLYLWIAYNVVLYAAIVVSGAILFMVMVGMVKVGGDDKGVKDDWIEVNSQILNGVFTWMAITNHPFFFYRLGKTLQVLGIRRWNWVPGMDKRVRAARYLSRHFPLVFVDTEAVHGHKVESTEAQDAAADDGEVYLLADNEETETLEEISYNRGDAENLLNTFVMLNWNCLFQYPITAVMWAYNADTRPGFVIGVFLPLSFLCNFGGQYRIFKLNKDIKARRSAAHHELLELFEHFNFRTQAAIDKENEIFSSTTPVMNSPEPATPILGDTYEPVSEPSRRQNVALIAYDAVLKIVIVIALVILLGVKAGVLDVGDKDVQDDWAEVASQVLNGVFTWMAITDQPSYIYRLVMTSRVLKARRTESNIQAAQYLSKHFPENFQSNFGSLEAQCGSDANVNLSIRAEKLGCMGSILFLRSDAKYLQTGYIFLNCGCFFQYVMSGFMWGYDASSRPGFVLPALLPPIALCNVVGQYRLYQLKKRTEDRQNLTLGCAPFPEHLSSTRNSQSPRSSL
ncbi:hypothetical protein PI126_g13894 [Phytophthora idaei]|nr:hypothetical protein PI126_g13894 [Phytophthora idaei]